MRTSALFVALLACKGEDAPTPTHQAPPDLAELLGPGEVRAGVVSNEAALFGGISAEGAPGDVKIYNQHIQFIIQGVRDGSYYLPQAGNVIDADIVRPTHQPGRDLVDEWFGMAGIGRLLQAEKVTVVADGSDGQAAIVRAEGRESPLELLIGAVETPGLIPDLGLEMVTEYRLEPDSWLLEVTTTYTATATATFTPGDAILGSADAATPWRPGTGLGDYDGRDLPWAGWVGDRNEGAVGLFLRDGGGTPGGLEVVSSLFDMAAVFVPPVTLQPGESHSFTRYYAVGPDMATLTDAWQEALEAQTEEVTGTVTAPDGPVAGARVSVFVDDEPFTLAFTDEDGTFSARVPAGSSHGARAEGRGTGWFWDHPEGAGSYSPYAGESARQATLASLSWGALPIPDAEGRGVAPADAPLTLGEPAWLVVRADDALPFTTMVRFTTPDEPVDARIARRRPSGNAAAGASRDGELRLAVEPGTYRVVVHRGMRFEAFEQEVTLAAGEETALEVSLPAAFAHRGWLFGDPHVHASPSADGGMSMEDRLVNQAGAGVQLHFGTDHDHIADYRPLIEPLGLRSVLGTVVASEVSPVLRGHLNVYPLVPKPGEANHGGYPWWRISVQSTDEQFALLRERFGGPLTAESGFVIQSNHPTSSGLADSAHWSPGHIGRPQYWSNDFDVIEVNNAGRYQDYLPVWLDLVARGHNVVPVGVTDSHHPFSGDPGLNGTFFGFGFEDPRHYTDDALRETLIAGRVIVSRGAFLSLSIAPGAVVEGPQELEVAARSASWAPIERLVLLKDGQIDQVVDGERATFTLDPLSDAFYVVIAESDTPMAPVWPNRTAWAMSNAIFVDVDGDGWEPPLPPLTYQDVGGPPPPLRFPRR